MEDSNAKISLSIREGKLEIEGPVDFVSKQIASFEELIRQALSEASKHLGDTGDREGEHKKAPEGEKKRDKGIPKHDNVLEVTEGKVKILCDIPGQSNKEKSINVALLCLFGSDTEGIEEVGFDAVREICRSHSCLDAANFSSHLNSAKQLLICSGSGKKQTVKLSVPGKRRAKALVEELNAQ